MAKQGKVLPARRRKESVDTSMLIRSAESLGRVIGTLQRQLDGATTRVADTVDDISEYLPFGNDGNGRRRVKTTESKADSGAASVRRARAATPARGKAGKTKTESTAVRKSKRAAKSASTRKTAGRGGSRKKTGGTTRRG